MGRPFYPLTLLLFPRGQWAPESSGPSAWAGPRRRGAHESGHDTGPGQERAQSLWLDLCVSEIPSPYPQVLVEEE